MSKMEYFLQKHSTAERDHEYNQGGGKKLNVLKKKTRQK